jgi:hypothetical protein
LESADFRRVAISVDGSVFQPGDSPLLCNAPATDFDAYHAVKNTRDSFSKPSTENSVNMPFSCYSFVTINGRSRLPSKDVDILYSKGSLYLPEKVILDESIRQYSLYIHPILPFLDFEACRGWLFHIKKRF